MGLLAPPPGAGPDVRPWEFGQLAAIQSWRGNTLPAFLVSNTHKHEIQVVFRWRSHVRGALKGNGPPWWLMGLYSYFSQSSQFASTPRTYPLPMPSKTNPEIFDLVFSVSGKPFSLNKQNHQRLLDISKPVWQMFVEDLHSCSVNAFISRYEGCSLAHSIHYQRQFC